MKLRTLLCSLAAMAVLFTACRKDPPASLPAPGETRIGFRSDQTVSAYRQWFSQWLRDSYGQDAGWVENFLQLEWENSQEWNDSTLVVPCRFLFQDTIGYSRMFFQTRNGTITGYNYTLIPTGEQDLEITSDELLNFSGNLLSIDLVKGPMDWIIYRDGRVTYYQQDHERALTFRDGETDPFIRPPEQDGAGGGSPGNVRHYGNWCRDYHCDCCGNDGPQGVWLTDWNINYPGINVHFNFPYSMTRPWIDGHGGSGTVRFPLHPSDPPESTSSVVPVDMEGIGEALELRNARRIINLLDINPDGPFANAILTDNQLSTILSGCFQAGGQGMDPSCTKQLLFEYLLSREGDLDDLNDFISNAPPWFWPFISETLAEVVIELVERQLGTSYNIPQNFLDAIRAIQQKNLLEFISNVNDIAANFGMPFRIFDALWDLNELSFQAYGLLDQLMNMSENIGPDPMTKLWMAMTKNSNLLLDFHFDQGDKALMIYGKQAEEFWSDLVVFFRVAQTFPDGWGKGGEFFLTGNLYFVYYPFSTSGMGPTVELRRCTNLSMCDGPPGNQNSVSLYKFRF